jgi:hypothetical protein
MTRPVRVPSNVLDRLAAKASQERLDPVGGQERLQSRGRQGDQCGHDRLLRDARSEVSCRNLHRAEPRSHQGHSSREPLPRALAIRR